MSTSLVLALNYYYRSPIRSSLAQQALERARQDDRVKAALGEPITTGLLAKGGIKQDESGWSEAKIEIPLTGSKGRGILRVAAGQGTGPWVISNLEVRIGDRTEPMHRTDLYVPDTIPLVLTRDYYNFGQNHSFASGAFGAGASDNYDICPFGSRNPYTYTDLYVGDGNYAHFNRISKGTGYADAVYEHSGTSAFYKARFWWSGGGWTLLLPGGTTGRPWCGTATIPKTWLRCWMERDTSFCKTAMKVDGFRN